jgi:hypothetical protein
MQSAGRQLTPLEHEASRPSTTWPTAAVPQRSVHRWNGGGNGQDHARGKVRTLRVYDVSPPFLETSPSQTKID